METSDWIALGAVIISVVTFISQMYSNRKSNLATSSANETQSEMLRLSRKVDDFENRKGEILLLNIIGRYFVLTINCFDQTSGKMRKDKASFRRYLSELKQLSDDFNELISNPFYIKFIEYHPDINLLIISLRGAIIEMEDQSEVGINWQTFEFFYNTYADIKLEISGNEILKHKFYEDIDNTANLLKVVILETHK